MKELFKSPFRIIETKSRVYIVEDFYGKIVSVFVSKRIAQEVCKAMNWLYTTNRILGMKDEDL